MRVPHVVLAAAACLAASAPLRAAPLLTVTEVSVVGDTVSITGPVGPVQTTAGPITLQSSLGTLVAWCVDLYHEVKVGGGQSLQYQVGTLTTDSAPTPKTLTAGQKRTIGQLAQYGQSLVGTAAGTNDALAAVQLAIWQTEYTSFTYTGAAGASVIQALVASAAFSSADADLSALNGTQSFVTANARAIASISPVPEPASLLLLGLAVPVLAATRRRRNAHAA